MRLLAAMWDSRDPEHSVVAGRSPGQRCLRNMQVRERCWDVPGGGGRQKQVGAWQLCEIVMYGSSYFISPNILCRFWHPRLQICISLWPRCSVRLLCMTVCFRAHRALFWVRIHDVWSTHFTNLLRCRYWSFSHSACRRTFQSATEGFADFQQRHSKGKGKNTTVSGIPKRPLSWALNRSFLFYPRLIIMERNYENVINLSFSSLSCYGWSSTGERSVPWWRGWVVISQFFQKQPVPCIMSGPWSRCSVLYVIAS